MRRGIVAVALAVLLTGVAYAQGLQQSGVWVGTPRAATLGVTALSAANVGVTATLPAAGPGQFHYITAVRVARTCTTAIVGNAALAVLSTNLPGNVAWLSGNACVVGTTNDVLNDVYPNPVRSVVANTPTTIFCPALGATGVCRITVLYFTGPNQ